MAISGARRSPRFVTGEFYGRSKIPTMTTRAAKSKVKAKRAPALLAANTIQAPEPLINRLTSLAAEMFKVFSKYSER
jgi:hypothetical protein